MKNVETLPNGIEVVYAFGEITDPESKKILFLAGTTPWNSNLVEDSWRRYFLRLIGGINFDNRNIVVCVPEPQFGKFTGRSDRHLIEWETECLDLSNVHAYWLNTYWTREQAVLDCNAESAKYFSDGSEANIGVTVRAELGCSFGRYKFCSGEFAVVVGAPHDAQGLAWLHIQSMLMEIPIYTLYNKSEVLDKEWFSRIVKELSS